MKKKGFGELQLDYSIPKRTKEKIVSLHKNGVTVEEIKSKLPGISRNQISGVLGAAGIKMPVKRSR